VLFDGIAGYSKTCDYYFDIESCFDIGRNCGGDAPLVTSGIIASFELLCKHPMPNDTLNSRIFKDLSE
jgi:hypothetical protein